MALQNKIVPAACDAAAATDRGRRRHGNEDAFGYSVEDGIYLVCDGMGGAAGGEMASSMAVTAVLERFAGWTAAAKPPAAALRESIAAANRAIYSYAQADFRLHGMGTTLVALLVEDRRAWVAHVGDSRCYRLRSGVLEQLTCDHSLVEEQVRLGRLTPSEAQRSPLRNLITRAVGSRQAVTADLEELSTEAGDLFLLSSDGLTREVGTRDITAILNRERDLDRACAALVQAANRAGGHDNITCLLVRAR